LVTAFHEGLLQAGYVEGENVTVEDRWAEGDSTRLAGLAAELVERDVDVIFSSGGAATALAAKTATAIIPIVFNTGGDPVSLGLVESLNQPGANVTGVNILSNVLEAKRLGLLIEAVPGEGDRPLAVLLNPTNPNSQLQMRDVLAVFGSGGEQVEILGASDDAAIEAAFLRIEAIGARGLLVGADPFFNSRRSLIISASERLFIPTIYEQREFVVAGGLMSYGTSLTEAYRQGGLYAGRILQGEQPSSLPVLQSAKFEFVINLRTASALGLTLPTSVLLAATEFVE